MFLRTPAPHQEPVQARARTAEGDIGALVPGIGSALAVVGAQLPLAVADDRFPLIVLESAGPTRDETDQLAGRLAAEGCRVLQLGDGIDKLPGSAGSILLDSRLPESLTPLPLSVAAQLLAYHLALSRGQDPDRPRVSARSLRPGDRIRLPRIRPSRDQYRTRAVVSLVR